MISYDPMNSTLEWFLLLDNSNRSGSMEFVVPPFDPAVFFPSSVNFASTTTYSGLKLTDMIPLRGDGGFVQSSELVTHEYTKSCEKKAFALEPFVAFILVFCYYSTLFIMTCDFLLL
ncbi:unnamed protein product [Brassica napus]|uniref:Coatomer subunit delta n=1 Tax=Brassica napus TaxID=3708 RepID=A0A816QX71_BRANA|nr:unnamed protein product [Brassica napus]